MKTFIVLAVTAACLLIASPVYAIGVSVTPAKASISVTINEPAHIRLKVANPSKDVALFEVYPDALEQLITITPKSFTLEAGAETFVTVKVTAQQEGVLTSDISVVARPLGDRTFQAGSGVKIPLVITATVEDNGLASAFISIGTSPWMAALALAGLVGIVAYRVGGKRRSQEIINSSSA